MELMDKGDNNESNRLDPFSSKTRWIMVRIMVCPSTSEAKAEEEPEDAKPREEADEKGNLLYIRYDVRPRITSYRWRDS